MPYLGRTPFLQKEYEGDDFRWQVSMPYLGRTPFLQGCRTAENVLELAGVNALSRTHSISTNFIKYGKLENIVSMPYLGRTPFLRSKPL